MKNKFELCLEEIETTLSIDIPKVFIDYLAEDEKSCGENNIYDIDDILEFNLTDEVNIYAPGYLIIGDDGGDSRYLMKSGKEETAVYISDCGDMNPKNFNLFSGDFSLWCKSDFSSEVQQATTLCRVILKELPDNLADVVRIKKEFNLVIKTSDFFHQAKNGSVILKDRISTALAMAHLDNLQDLAKFIEVQLYEQ